MEHLNEGALRRLYDDPLALSDRERAHFAECGRCRERFDQVAADARGAAGALAVPAFTVDAGGALSAVRGRTAIPAPRRVLRFPGGRWRPALAAGVAAVAVAVLAVTGLAEQLLTIAQPDQVAPVPVTTSEQQALADLYHFGTIGWNGQASLQPVGGADAAASAAGFSAPSAGWVPAGTPSRIMYEVMGASTGTFTFDQAKAEAWASQQGETLPGMPAGLDGSTLTLNVGPAVAELYGGYAVQTAGSSGLPGLVIGKMRSPSLESTGPSVADIESYLLSLPGITPQLAAQIKAIGDPTQVLPLPIPVDRATSETVDINGVQGVLVGDNTGLGAGVIWVKDGYVYGVAGTLSQDDVLAVARSLS